MEITVRLLTVRDEPFLWDMLYHALFVDPGQAPFVREIIYEPPTSRYVAGWGRLGDAGVVASCDGHKV